jgi:hypothetical protein
MIFQVVSEGGGCAVPSQWWCENCGETLDLLKLKEACALVGISRRLIYYWMDKGGLHLFKNAGGRTLICKRSLLQYDAQRRRVKAE